VPHSRTHLSRAIENEQFADSLNSSSSLETDWAITALFYSAVHYVDAYLVVARSKPIDHQERERMIERNGTLSGIFMPYRELKRMSRAARYDIASYGPRELAKAKRLLGEIKAVITPRL
jgi:hypothetical protein